MADGAQTSGVILGFGGTAAGLTLYLDKGVPVFDYNYFEKQTAIRGKVPLKSGDSIVEVDFDYLGKKGEVGKGANVTLKVDGAVVATGKLDQTVAGRFGIDTFGVGEDTGQPVTPAYEPPFKYTGEIDKVVVSVK